MRCLEARIATSAGAAQPWCQAVQACRRSGARLRSQEREAGFRGAARCTSAQGARCLADCSLGELLLQVEPRRDMPRRAAVGLTATGGSLREGDRGARTPSPLRMDEGLFFTDPPRALLLEEARNESEYQDLGVWVNGPGDVRLVSFTPLTLPARTGKSLRSSAATWLAMELTVLWLPCIDLSLGVAVSEAGRMLTVSRS